MPPTRPSPRPAAPATGAEAAEARPAKVGRVIGAIPARWASTRLPGKPLVEIAGRPMIEHVYRRASRAPSLARAVVLTDDERIARAVEAFGGDCEMTPAECASGTDRIAHAARSWPVAAIVNIQGDEPLIDPEAVEAVARHLLDHPEDPIVTMAVPMASPAPAEVLRDPNTVKVVRDARGYALYFSRAGIPYPRRPGAAPVLRHVGIYGYQHAALLRLASLPPTPLERSESLEQLRALENGIAIRVLETAAAEGGVDTPEDLAEVAAKLAEFEAKLAERGGDDKDGNSLESGSLERN